MISETPGDDFKKFSFIMFPYRVIGFIWNGLLRKYGVFRYRLTIFNIKHEKNSVKLEKQSFEQKSEFQFWCENLLSFV